MALYWTFFSPVAVNLLHFPAAGKQGPLPKEIFQTMLTNKKHGPLTLLCQPCFASTGRNTLKAVLYYSKEHFYKNK
jgi:hypothetical protein